MFLQRLCSNPELGLFLMYSTDNSVFLGGKRNHVPFTLHHSLAFPLIFLSPAHDRVAEVCCKMITSSLHKLARLLSRGGKFLDPSSLRNRSKSIQFIQHSWDPTSVDLFNQNITQKLLQIFSAKHGWLKPVYSYSSFQGKFPSLSRFLQRKHGRTPSFSLQIHLYMNTPSIPLFESWFCSSVHRYGCSCLFFFL